MSDFPRIDRSPSGALMLITGQRVRPDGSLGCLVGYPVDANSAQQGLDRCKAFDEWDPPSAHREWPIHGPCICRQCREKAERAVAEAA